MMQKVDIIDDISYRTGYVKNDIKKIMDTFIEVVTDAVNRGEDVQINNLMKIYRKYYKARTRYNLTEDKVVPIPAEIRLKIDSLIKFKNKDYNPEN